MKKNFVKFLAEYFQNFKTFLAPLTIQIQHYIHTLGSLSRFRGIDKRKICDFTLLFSILFLCQIHAKKNTPRDQRGVSGFLFRVFSDSFGKCNAVKS